MLMLQAKQTLVKEAGADIHVDMLLLHLEVCIFTSHPDLNSLYTYDTGSHNQLWEEGGQPHVGTLCLHQTQSRACHSTA